MTPIESRDESQSLRELLTNCRATEAMLRSRADYLRRRGEDDVESTGRLAERWRAWGDALAALIERDEKSNHENVDSSETS